MKHHTQSYILITRAGVLLTFVFAMFTLYGTLVAPQVSEATESGASCTISSQTTVLNSGSTTTLTWNITGGDSVQVSIDRFPGQLFARSGSLEVTPTETTTYTARTEGGAQQVSCSTTVTVQQTSGTTTPACDPATLTISGNTFTWKGCPPMERYEATFCNGTTVGPVYGTWEGDTTIELASRIASVRACGEDCTRTAMQSCPVAPEPEYPTCPFTATAHTSVVTFEKNRLYSSKTEADAKTRTYALSLPAGAYKVEAASWDGYADRVHHTQPNERWFAQLLKGGSAVVRTNATTDLADYAVHAFRSETLHTTFTIPSAVDGLYAKHAQYPDTTSHNSVFPVCVAFTKLPDPQTPSCTLTLSPSSITRGGTATLAWTGVGVTGGVIDQGVGTTSASGNVSVSPTANTTYTGTFTKNTGGAVTCSATLAVTAVAPTVATTGGGGSCLNCGDYRSVVSTTSSRPSSTARPTVPREEEKKTPNIVLASTITNPGGFITLDQVPYTGFEAGPIATVFFWGAVFALSVLIAHVFTHTDVRSRLSYAVATIRARYQKEDTPRTESPSFISMQLAPPVQTPQIALRQEVDGVARDNGVGMIETAAHAHNILLSPEATRLFMAAIGTQRGTTVAFLDALFAKAMERYPREDGWILVSRERAEALIADAPKQAEVTESTPAEGKPLSTSHDERPHRLEPTRVATETSRSTHTAPATPVAPPAQSAPTPPPHTSAPAAPVEQRHNEQQSVSPSEVETLTAQAVPLFVESIATGDQHKAYDLLRHVLGKGVIAEVFIARVIRKLDDIYKNRLEGNHNPDKDLAIKTAMWSNADFEIVLGILIECVDYSYSNSKIGTKIALAKVFAHFAQK